MRTAAFTGSISLTAWSTHSGVQSDEDEIVCLGTCRNLHVNAESTCTLPLQPSCKRSVWIPYACLCFSITDAKGEMECIETVLFIHMFYKQVLGHEMVMCPM